MEDVTVVLCVTGICRRHMVFGKDSVFNMGVNGRYTLKFLHILMFHVGQGQFWDSMRIRTSKLDNTTGFISVYNL
jgi:hypothetical protein